MKNFACFLLAILFLLPVQESFAQLRPEIGIRAGGALAELSGKDDVFGERTTDYQPGFTGGIYADLPVAGNFSVQPEILYVQKGGRLNEDLSDGPANMSFRSDFNLDYVEVPVLLKYNIPTNSRFSPSIYAGPYAAYAVNRDMSVKFTGDGNDMNLKLDADDMFRRWDYGATAGADLGYMIGARKATIGVRYDLGLANIFHDEINLGADDANLINAKARTHEIGLVLGFRLW